MKNIKKFLATFFVILTLTNLLKPINASANNSTVTMCLHNGSMHVRLRKSKKINERIEKLRKHLNKKYNVPILDGGAYGNTARADGYECHHLISSHFCKRHRYCISKYKAPAVLIPKAVHRLTGSHPLSGHMRCYFKLEKRFYKEWGLHGVVALGIIDLIYAFKQYNKITNASGTPVKSSGVVNQTPIKDALVQLETVSPWKTTPFIYEYFVTPIKKQTYPAPICAARKLLFDGLND